MKDKKLMSPEEQMLKSAAQKVDASPAFKNELEKKLMNAHKPNARFGLLSVLKITAKAGWAIGIAALVLTFIWVIRSIAPQPQPAADNTPFPIIETSTPEPRIPPEGKTYKTSMEDFIMTIDFPEAAAQSALYRQIDPASENEDYEIETIRDLAARIGIQGELYHLQDHNGEPGFMFTDGKQRLEIWESTPYQFVYYTNTSNHLLQPQSSALSSEEMSIMAEGFLTTRGLLDFPYQITLSPDAQNHMVTFEPRLSDLPQSFTFNNLTTFQVTLDENSEVFMVYGNTQPCESIGNYPLISAQQAWNKFIINELNGLGVEMQAYGYTPSNFRRWEHEIPLDQPTRVVGWVESFRPVDGELFLVVMDGVPLVGKLEGLVSINDTVQLDGQFIMDASVKKFQVNSWKVTDPILTLDGTLEKGDGQTWLVTSDGKRLEMDDVPADIPLGEMTIVNGVISGDKLDWKTIDQGQGGGGGGGGGGGAGLARVNLSGTPMPTATPWPISTPEDHSPLIGTHLSGERGNVDIMNLRAEDGSTRYIYKLSSDSESGFFDTFWQVTLEGPATDGLEAYYRLPVKVWGTLTSIDPQGTPIIQLDRYEVVYPDVAIQIWYGQETTKQLEGKDVLLFTADDGTSYVRKGSIQYGGEATVAEKDLVFFVGGWVIPDQTFGGYPVLNDITSGTTSKDSPDLLVSKAFTPPTLNESDINLSGVTPTRVINRIELVYLSEGQLLAEFDEGRDLYVQPFWRFSGYDNETNFFDIIVQALPDEYLQPVPLQ